MFEEFSPFTITTQSNPKVDIYGLKSNNASCNLPPLLLLHGFPQTHHIWHRVVAHLISKYTVILIDLRGYGQSSKPADDISAYAKSAMARDCIAIMDHLGFQDQQFFACAHDRGARVAHKLLVDYPERVKSAIFLDICPTLAMYESTNLEFAKAYFHWFFLIQKAPLPETMILSAPKKVAEMFMGGRQTDGLSIFEEGCWENYVGNLSDESTVHAMCQDYRASASLDLEEARKDLREGRRIKCPLVVLWARHGVIEKCFDAVTEWKAVADEGVKVKGRSVDSGHYLPEQASEEVVRAILEYLV